MNEIVRQNRKFDTGCELERIHCQSRSDDAGIISVTGRVGIPDIKADADVFVLLFANGTN